MSITAITLGGGGSKGDFEVGALHYVYNVLGRPPAVLTCTSVGSINGLKLAEGEGTQEQGLAGLTSIWLSLEQPEDFWNVSPWLEQNSAVIRYVRQIILDILLSNAASVEEMLAVNDALRDLRRAEAAAISQRLADISGVSSQLRSLGGLLAAHLAVGLLPTPTGVIASAATAGALIASLAATADELADAVSAESLFTLNPLRARAASLLDRDLVAAWAARGGRLRMAAVGLRSGELRFVTESGLVVDRDGTPLLETEPRVAGCGPEYDLVSELADEIDEVQKAIARRERTIQEPPPSLGELKIRLASAETALATCLAGQVPVRLPVTVDLLEGMFASASVPAFFAPVVMGEDQYVDGGIRMVIPIEPALSLTGPEDEIIAIVASRMDPDELGGPSPTMSVAALRSLMDIAINELARRDTKPSSGFPNRRVQVVQPRIDIHTLVAVDPAFVRQRMAYGFMCAADTFAPPTQPEAAEEARQAADRISVLRYGVVRLERWLADQPVPPNNVRLPAPDSNERNRAASTISAMKQEIRGLVERRLALAAGMPTGSGGWDDPTTWWYLPEAGLGAPTRRQLDAAFVRQTIPVSLLAGAAAQVVVVMQNTGLASWSVSGGQALVPVGAGWGVTRVPVARDVPLADQCEFAFDITAPATTGLYAFEWRMSDASGNVFGEPSESFMITVVPPGEPAECATIRARAEAIRREIGRLEALLRDDPQFDGPRLRVIAQLRLEAEAGVARAQAIGCVQ